MLQNDTLQVLNKEKVNDYILNTKKHFQEVEFKDKDLNLFLDLDLSGFSLMDKEEYMKNGSGIKFEYSHHLDNQQWLNGRKSFLSFVLKKKKIYRSDYFYNNFEKTARENIQYEIDNLV